MAATKTFNISFPKSLVDEIDSRAMEQFGSRSDFLRAAVIDYIKQQQEWEYLFREGQKIGSQANQLSAQAVADQLTAGRRQSGRWFVAESA